MAVTATTTISDPDGDAGGYADILNIAGGYDTSNLYLTATFAPGTFSASNVAFFFALDTDQSLSTGTQPPAWPRGQDYSVSFNSLSGTLTAQIHQNFVPVEFGSNSLGITVPLSFLGNDDGLMNFGFIVGVPVTATSFVPHDWTPNNLNTAGLLEPTSPVPEPAADHLLLGGLAVLARILSPRRVGRA